MEQDRKAVQSASRLGSICSYLDSTWARQNNMPIYQREMPRLIENFTGKIESEFGHSFTYPMRLQHRKHFSMDSFEIGQRVLTVM
jgi:hypothetical protein